MFSPLKCVLGEYKSFVVKMHMDVLKSQACCKKTWILMCDFELVFGLPCILPMLEVVHKLIKYTQRCVNYAWVVMNLSLASHNLEAKFFFWSICIFFFRNARGMYEFWNYCGNCRYNDERCPLFKSMRGCWVGCFKVVIYGILLWV